MAIVSAASTRHRRRLARRSIAVLLAAFAGLLTIVRADRSATIDLAITRRVQRRHSSVLVPLMAAASWPGFPPQSRILPPLVISGWLLAGRPRAAGFQALAWGAALLSTAVKATVRRQRPVPPEVRVVAAPLRGSSFPSGHVLTYVGFYGFLARLIWIHGPSPLVRRVGAGSLLVLIGLVGPSRIEQGHHWTTDVLASYLLGLAYLAGLASLYETTDERSDAPMRTPA
jgi:membrane-associated phospholipid phosphatase